MENTIKTALICLLLVGCKSPVPVPQPSPAPKSPPPLPKVQAKAIARPAIVPAPEAIREAQFIYPATNNCLHWVLQSSVDLINWTDEEDYGYTCPSTNSIDVDPALPQQFFRMKGTP